MFTSSVGILVVAIVIHHVLFDRDPYKVPMFVRNSWQFTHEDSDQEEFFLEDASGTTYKTLTFFVSLMASFHA